MAILIRDPETETLIRQLADRSSESITDAVRAAVVEKLMRLPRKKGRIDRARLAEAQAAFAAAPLKAAPEPEASKAMQDSEATQDNAKAADDGKGDGA